MLISGGGVSLFMSGTAIIESVLQDVKQQNEPGL
jgi:hypothetical protein